MTLLGVLVASLLGSPHCAAMCGPLVAFYGTAGAGEHRRWAAHAIYNGTRLATYVVLGMLAGSLGAGLNRLGALAGVTRLAAVVAGVTMVVWGTATIAATRGLRLPWLHGPSWATRPLLAATARARAWPSVARSATMGAATALLPCGWLYAFVAVAAGTGSATAGAAAMAVFWLGTLPLLVTLGLGVQRLAGPLRARLPVLTAAVAVLLGLLSIGGRLHIPAHLPGATGPASVRAGHR